MRVLFCGGGTAGHITPALAIAEIICEYENGATCEFVGRKGGRENDAIIKEGYKLHEIDVMGFSRTSLFSNFSVLKKLGEATKKSAEIINSFSPDLIIGTGGYVCWPVIKAGIKLGIRTILHESNAVAGLACKSLAKDVDLVMLGFEGAREGLPRAAKILVSGNPVSKKFLKTDRRVARRKLGIREGDFLIVSFGGSLGAEVLNRRVIECMSEYEAKERGIIHLHGVGHAHFDALKGIRLPRGKRIVPYIENMPLWLSAADLAITRSGAMTVSEILAAGVPSILIPSPNVSGNHQYKNAKELQAAGASMLLDEKSLTSSALYEMINKIRNDRKLRDGMISAANNLYDKNISNRVMSAILGVLDS